ncbi:hypothetical protein VAMP_5n196 [Candidatus Vampirococcus lugosii]|uniref:Uncharacterized protein n=2 Tax=Candidatus Vampirococcus lugosii TaxID=2789015 RepID=A0ABS5QK75_9BACT|nr:hypothetical protein [Candidatus Vampirococcus lugosii]
MYEIVFNTSPNILNYITINIILLIIIYIIFFLSIFFFIFVSIKLVENLIMYRKIDENNKEFIENIKKYYLEKLKNYEGNEFIKYFVSYIEKIMIKNQYKSIEDVLSKIGINNEIIQEIEEIIYNNKSLDKDTENIIRSKLKNL